MVALSACTHKPFEFTSHVLSKKETKEASVELKVLELESIRVPSYVFVCVRYILLCPPPISQYRRIHSRQLK